MSYRFVVCQSIEMFPRHGFVGQARESVVFSMHDENHSQHGID